MYAIPSQIVEFTEFVSEGHGITDPLAGFPVGERCMLQFKPCILSYFGQILQCDDSDETGNIMHFTQENCTQALLYE